MMEDVEVVEVEDVVKVVKIGKNTYTCFDLEYGFLMDVESGKIPNTKHEAIVNATDLTLEDVKRLRVSAVDKLYGVISRLTYPDLYDENGDLKTDLPDIPEDDDDKKKV